MSSDCSAEKVLIDLTVIIDLTVLNRSLCSCLFHPLKLLEVLKRIRFEIMAQFAPHTSAWLSVFMFTTWRHRK